MNYEFTEQELLDLGFREVPDTTENGPVVYYEYIFDCDDYFNSKFLYTEDINPQKIIASYSVGREILFRVLNNIDPDNGELYLTRDEVKELIKNN